MLKLETYENKSDIFDVLWLLGELKKANSGINTKVNLRLTMHKTVAALYKMKQGQHEANDYYLERFKAALLTVELAKGCSHLCVMRTYQEQWVYTFSERFTKGRGKKQSNTTT